MTLLGPALQRRRSGARVGADRPRDLSTVTREILLDEGQRRGAAYRRSIARTSVCSLESQKFNQRLGECRRACGRPS